MESIAYLSIGTNLGDRPDNIKRAIELLTSEVGVVIKKSRIYVTEPHGFLSDSDFLNLCISIKTSLPPKSLLNKLKHIEVEIGRTKKSKEGVYESRVIDLDIILYGNKILDSDDLRIPHPRYTERLFVLKPLNEIASNTNDPIFDKTIKQLLVECIDQSTINFYENEFPSNE